jgi:hypothetical protein
MAANRVYRKQRIAFSWDYVADNESNWNDRNF